MSFQPVVLGSGLAGWRFLQRTYESQFDSFNKAPQLDRNTEYFSEKIGSITSAEDLVSDRRLLTVALGAFGLSDDLDNRYFIQKILEDGTSSTDALANKLSDNRYKRLSEAFGFGPGEIPRTLNSAEMDKVTESFKVQSFEVSVGEQDDTLRIALYAQRELIRLANEPITEDAKWFSMMALPPLRAMFEMALGLPSAFGAISIDKQLEVFQDRTQGAIGEATIAQFSDPDSVEKLTTLYLARSQIALLNTSASSSSNALVLLRSIQL